MISKQDLIDRFGETELAQLTDREQATVIDDAVLNKAIADAESEIESYLNLTGLFFRDEDGSLVYRLAAHPPKPLIIKACDIARYYLYEDGDITIVKERYQQAIAWLKLVMKNPAMLTGNQDTAKIKGQNGVYVLANPVPDYWED